MRSASLKFGTNYYQLPALVVLPALFTKRPFIMRCIVGGVLVNAALLASYLAVMAALIHDEKSIQENQARLAVVAAEEETLTVKTFGEENLRMLEAQASILGLVPIGKAQYLAVPMEGSFAQSSEQPLHSPGP